MLKYVATRLIQGVLLLVVFLALIYLLLEAQPGDIALQLSANPRLPPEAQDILRARLGLDEPLLQRTVTYVVNFFKGDLGASFTQYPRTVGSLIMERLAPDDSPLPLRDGPRLLPGLRLGQGHGVATGQVLRNRPHAGRGGGIHRFLSVVRHSDALALRLHHGMVPARQVHRPG